MVVEETTRVGFGVPDSRLLVQGSGGWVIESRRFSIQSRSLGQLCGFQLLSAVLMWLRNWLADLSRNPYSETVTLSPKLAQTLYKRYSAEGFLYS